MKSIHWANVQLYSCLTSPTPIHLPLRYLVTHVECTYTAARSSPSSSFPPNFSFKPTSLSLFRLYDFTPMKPSPSSSSLWRGRGAPAHWFFFCLPPVLKRSEKTKLSLTPLFPHPVLLMMTECLFLLLLLCLPASSRWRGRKKEFSPATSLLFSSPVHHDPQSNTFAVQVCSICIYTEPSRVCSSSFLLSFYCTSFSQVLFMHASMHVRMPRQKKSTLMILKNLIDSGIVFLFFFFYVESHQQHRPILPSRLSSLFQVLINPCRLPSSSTTRTATKATTLHHTGIHSTYMHAHTPIHYRYKVTFSALRRGKKSLFSDEIEEEGWDSGCMYDDEDDDADDNKKGDFHWSLREKSLPMKRKDRY